MIKTEAGEKMKEENPVNGIKTIDGQELLRQELEKEGKKFGMPETPEMNMGGLMHDGIGVIIGIEEESGNEIPAGSKAEEVADDIPAMLSEGEYVAPADVVRWHGVKMFEELRCEAKMGMGLMAQDGRIAEVDGEAYEQGHDDPEYDIEEKDKPEVEEHKVEVVEAAEGVSIQDGAENVSAVDIATTPTLQAPWKGLRQSYYGYKTVYNPETQRYEFKPVDPETDEFVEEEEFDPDKATRYTPRKVVAQEVYGTEGVTDEEAAAMEEGETVEDTEEEDTTEETPTCPAGQVYDSDIGACVPVYDDEEEPSTPSVSREVGNNFGFTGTSNIAVATITAIGGPVFGALAKAGNNINNAQAVNAARVAVGLPELTAGEIISSGVTGKYNDGVVGDIDIGDNSYTVSLGVGGGGGVVGDEYVPGIEQDAKEYGGKAIAGKTSLTVAEAQRRAQMAEQQAARAKAQQEKVAEEERQRIAAEQRAREAAAQRAREAEAARVAAEAARIAAEQEISGKDASEFGDQGDAAPSRDLSTTIDTSSSDYSEPSGGGSMGGTTREGTSAASSGSFAEAAGSTGGDWSYDDSYDDPDKYAKGGYVTKKTTPRKTMIKY